MEDIYVPIKKIEEPRIVQLKPFLDQRGLSFHDIFSNVKQNMLSNGKSILDFQVNYSTLHPGIIKAWHRHKNQDDYFCVLSGDAKVGIVTEDPANGGETKIESYCIGESNPAVIHINAGEWHGLTAIGNKPCGLLYFVTQQYNPEVPDEERANYTRFTTREWWLPKNE